MTRYGICKASSPLQFQPCQQERKKERKRERQGKQLLFHNNFPRLLSCLPPPCSTCFFSPFRHPVPVPKFSAKLPPKTRDSTSISPIPPHPRFLFVSLPLTHTPLCHSPPPCLFFLCNLGANSIYSALQFEKHQPQRRVKKKIK